ncbi:hypothetical protein N7G274_008579 [Stereocaulon virgatum]|uniref:Uncharacterized protein n=1 Tax=Stereocaulon virgatum TaxID=373712 RepID=A0ABR4A1G1_9LECA
MKTIAQTKKFLEDTFSGPGGSDENYNKYSGHLTWLQVTSTAILHEMMHTDLIGKPGPHIGDESVDPSNIGRKAYGPKAVWQLANRAISKGGGAKRASTNADSYAQMMTAMYWSNFVSGFAGDDLIPNDPDANDNDAPVTPSNWDTIPIFLYFGNVTDPNTDWESLYTAAAEPSFFPTPTTTAAAMATPIGPPSDIVDNSVCGGCPGNGN